MGIRQKLKSKHLLFSIAVTVAVLALPVQSSAQSLGGIPGLDFGTVSAGLGFYNAPGAEADENGLFGLVRLEISQFSLELDYTLEGSNTLLGAIDYLYYVPAMGSFTQTDIAVGAGGTFVLNDGIFNGSNGGINVLAKVRLADTISAQVRYDILNGDTDLLTFGLSYAFY